MVYFPDGAGGDRFEEKEFKGPLAHITRQALSFIKAQYLKEAVVKHPDRAEAERFWNFPYAAIEEAVVNAVYHRSYEIREPIEIRIDAHELMVLSFPGPDRSIRLDDLQVRKAVSRRYRNRRIGEFLKELDLTEGRSTGLPKILRVMQSNGSPMPVFETDEERSYFLIRLPIHAGFAETEQVTDHVAPHVTPQVKALLLVIFDEMSRVDLMQALNLKDRSYFRKAYLNPALELGLVEMTQPDSPRSPSQTYQLTSLGRQALASL